MSPAPSDLEIRKRAATRARLDRCVPRRLALYWRVEALVYAFVLLAFGAVPLALLRVTVDPLRLIHRAPFVVLEAGSLAVGVMLVEVFIFLLRRSPADDGDAAPSRCPLNGDWGGTQPGTARHSNHEHGSNTETLDTGRGSASETEPRSRSDE